MNVSRNLTPPPHLSIGFMRASIETALQIFDDEQQADFANWERIPSTTLRSKVASWRSMGPRAKLAHEQNLVQYYQTIGLWDALTIVQQQMVDFSIFEEAKRLLRSERLRCNHRNHPNNQSRGREHGAMGKIKTALLANPAFGSIGSPIARIADKGVLKLSFLDSGPEVAVNICFCVDESAPAMRHNGLHGVVTCNNEYDIDISGILSEIDRNLRVLALNLDKKGAFELG